MTRQTFILRTSSGALIHTFDTREKAEHARLTRQKDFPKPLVITRQTVIEEQVA